MSKKTSFLAAAGISAALCVLFFAGCKAGTNNTSTEYTDPATLIGSWKSEKKGSLTIHEDYSFNAMIRYGGKEFGIIGLTKIDIPVTGKMDFNDSALTFNDCILKDLEVHTEDLETRVTAILEDALITAYISLEPNFTYMYTSLDEDSDAKEAMRESILQLAINGPDAETLILRAEEAMNSIKNIAEKMNLETITVTPTDEEATFIFSSPNLTVQKFWGGNFTREDQ